MINVRTLCKRHGARTVQLSASPRRQAVIAAAGNGAADAATYSPGGLDGVIAVGAVDRAGARASYSNFGNGVAIATAGGDPRLLGNWGMALGDDGLLTLGNAGTTGPRGGIYTREAGTSFAAPVVAGVIGLMLSVNPSLSATQIVQGLQRSARPHVVSPKIAACSDLNPGRCICSTATCGAGILDADGALHYALAPDAYVAPARQAEVIDNIDVSDAIALGADRPANSGTAVPASDNGGGGALGQLGKGFVQHRSGHRVGRGHALQVGVARQAGGFNRGHQPGPQPLGGGNLVARKPATVHLQDGVVHMLGRHRLHRLGIQVVARCARRHGTQHQARGDGLVDEDGVLRQQVAHGLAHLGRGELAARPARPLRWA